jgi:hypothetical protein
LTRRRTHDDGPLEDLRRTSQVIEAVEETLVRLVHGEALRIDRVSDSHNVLPKKPYCSLPAQDLPEIMKRR